MTYKLEANRGVSGGASHNSIRHGQTLQKLPTDHLCNAFTSALHYAEVNNGNKSCSESAVSTYLGPLNTSIEYLCQISQNNPISRQTKSKNGQSG